MIKLKEDENIILRLERSYRAYVAQFAVAAMMASVASILLFWLLQFGQTGWLIFAGLMCVAMLIFLHAYHHRTRNLLIITDQRVVDIDREGLFKKNITELTYDLVEDITVKQHGMLSTWLKLGTVSIIGSHGNMRLEFINCPDPISVQELILDAREALMDKKRFGATGAHLEAHNRLPVITREIKMLSYKQLTRLKEAVDARMAQYHRTLEKRKRT